MLQGKNIYINYNKKEVIKDVSIDVRKGEIVAIIGPNGSGKSTILKTLSRTLKPNKGQILLEGNNIKAMNTKAIAQKLAILPQVRSVPGDISVEALVSYGRYPHLGFGHRLHKQDFEIIDWAIEKTDLTQLRHRFVDTLSGGERQRAWIAMALAQNPSILLLDEPTTFLDISYQLETLELIKELNEKLGLTIVMVLHDLNQAVRYSHKIYALNKGKVHCFGESNSFLNEEFLKDVFRIEGDIVEDQANKCHYLIPQKVVQEAKP
ncbi:MAG: iron ABC transporter ATP-binding protein [Clostridiales bacterium GWB2_37_7]|nr:MAG: iron ABC transporter ATP-binding protein [Clostridiales bacterium GWB2_37_7]